MRFRLRYSGLLKSEWLKDKDEKQKVRRVFHLQMKDLWDRVITRMNEGRSPVRWDPFKAANEGEVSVIETVGKFAFAPFVSQAYGWNAVADLDVLFLRASEPGQLINHGGDIDNRIKVLFDCLRMPQNLAEMPENDQPAETEIPFCVLLQDDALVTGYNVVTDRLLAPPAPNHVEIIISVEVRATRSSLFTAGLF